MERSRSIFRQRLTAAWGVAGSLLFGRLVSPSSGGFSLSNSSVVAFCAVELDTLEMSKQNLIVEK
jgi:hypothetical protein